MFIHVPDHFSSHFVFDMRKHPATATDRSSLFFVFCGWLCGALLLCLGLFELFSFLTAEQNNGQSFLLVEIFAFVIILIALGLIIGATFSFIRSKKFIFDGNSFTIIYRPAIGIRHTLTEPLENYAGVRLRVLFVQSGLFNKSRYIIDLYHKDNNKIIPLYISTKNNNIRNIWESYARQFSLPALSIGDRGLVRRECADLDKSLKELFAEGKLPYIASGKLPAPESLNLTDKLRETVITPKGIFWDVFSSLSLFIAIAAVFLLTAGAVYLTIIGADISGLYWAIGGGVLLATAYFFLRLFCSYRLILTPKEVTIIKTLFGANIGKDSLDNAYIENVELSYNPTIDRYSLSVISDDKIITFGSRLPVGDLLWLKDFVIRKLVGN